MSDSSGDSSIGVEFSAVDAALPNQHGSPAQNQEISNSESESESSSEEEGSGAALVESTPMSKKLGYVDVFAMKSKVDKIHAWLKGLLHDSTEDHTSIPNSTLRHHKRTLNTMRYCLWDAAPMAIKMRQYMEASVDKYTTTLVNKAIEKMMKSEGAGSVAMKELLAQTTFKEKLLEDIEQELLKSEKFPFGKPNHLNTKIGEIVNSYLGRVLLEQAQKQTEAKLLEKFNADTKKSLEAVKEKLKGAGLMMRSLSLRPEKDCLRAH